MMLYSEGALIYWFNKWQAARAGENNVGARVVMSSFDQADEFERQVGKMLTKRYSSRIAKVSSGVRLGNGDGGRALLADYAIYIVGQSTPSLIVEVKLRFTEDILRRLITSAKRSRVFAGNDVRFVLAAPDTETGQPLFYDLTSYIAEDLAPSSLEEMVALDQLPDLNALTAGIQVSDNKRAERRSNRFKWACRILGALAVIVAVLNSMGKYDLSWEKLALLAAICVLFLLPYTNFVKYKDYMLYLNHDFNADDEKE